MKFLIFLNIIAIFSFGCSTFESSKVDSLPNKKIDIQKADLSNVDLTEIKHMLQKAELRMGVWKMKISIHIRLLKF